MLRYRLFSFLPPLAKVLHVDAFVRLKMKKIITLITGLLLANSISALEVGQPAPDFSLPGSDGQTHRLLDYRGQVVVLAWFPKAFTGS